MGDQKYLLEIETLYHIKKIVNPRKALIFDNLLWHSLKVLDDDGKWHYIGRCHWTYVLAVEPINSAIKAKEAYVNVQDYIL